MTGGAMRIIAALLIGSFAFQSMASAWNEDNDASACQIVGSAGEQRITYQFNGLLAEAAIEFSSPRLKAHCDDNKSVKATITFGSRSVTDEATVFCSGEDTPIPTAIMEIGSLDSPMARDLANAQK